MTGTAADPELAGAEPRRRLRGGARHTPRPRRSRRRLQHRHSPHTRHTYTTAARRTPGARAGTQYARHRTTINSMARSSQHPSSNTANLPTTKSRPPSPTLGRDPTGLGTHSVRTQSQLPQTPRENSSHTTATTGADWVQLRTRPLRHHRTHHSVQLW